MSYMPVSGPLPFRPEAMQCPGRYIITLNLKIACLHPHPALLFLVEEAPLEIFRLPRLNSPQRRPAPQERPSLLKLGLRHIQAPDHPYGFFTRLALGHNLFGFLGDPINEK
jgi:hypothetical protein